ncbi:hypothetical protein MWU50_06260 [Flavobacteriaceae bacterium S0862]|nr:hypothetical protein [Flavobacteriaceae bacterium S0862]
MKKLLAITFLILGIMSIYGQEKGKFRVGLDLGYVFSQGQGGLLFSIEPKYNLTDNSNIGFRLGAASDISLIGGDSVGSLLGTYDYYFNIENPYFSPFLGAGLGLYFSERLRLFAPNISENKLGVLIRGGAELGKFRITLEYNIIPKSDLESGEGTKNSYFGASVGFYIGGGKWKN